MQLDSASGLLGTTEIWRSRGAAVFALLCLLAVGARAQGVRYDNIVLGPRGTPVAAAQIAVCTSAAVRTTTPCSPLAQIYSDQGLTQPAANPFPADSLGNYGFWAEPGHYVLQIYGTGLTTRTMDVFLACDPTNCSMTSATFSTITAGTLNLSGSLTVNGRSVATEPLASDGVQYVSPNGNDSNDGLSWGTAKQTLYAAVNALESASGGTVYVAPDTTCGGPVSGQGLWLVGSGDVSSGGYSNPPAGWIKAAHSLKIVGVGVESGPGTGTTQNAPAPAINLDSCGSSGANPALWLDGTTWGTEVEIDNLTVQTAANNALVIGYDTEGSPLNSGGSDIVFNNDSFSVPSNGTAGPAVNIGANVFWVRFNNIGITADSSATALSDAHQAVVVDPTPSASNGSGLIFFNHLVVNAGGIHFYGNAGSNSGSLYVNDLTTEGQNDGSPAVWLTPTTSNGAASEYVIRNVTVADATVNPTYAVDVDNSSASPDITMVWSAQGNGADVEGPMTFLGGEDGYHAQTQTQPPTMQNLQGFWGGRLWARYINDGDLSFTLRDSPWPDLVSPVPTSTVSGIPNWSNSTGGSLTQVAAPDGSQNAYELPTAGSDGLYFLENNESIAAGDYLIAGVWSRIGPSGSGGYAFGEPFNLSVLGSGCGTSTVAGAAAGESYSDKNWQWNFWVLKVTSGGSGCQINFGTRTTSYEEVFAPVLLHIPVSAGLTDADALNLGMSLRSTSPLSSSGVYATLPNHPIAFGGSGDSYLATLDHTALTADQTYDFPNASGTIGLVLTGTSGSIGGSSLTAGACTSGTVSISGATTSMAVAVSPAADPGSGFTWEGWVSATGTATVRLCNTSGASATPTAETYNVRVIE